MAQRLKKFYLENVFPTFVQSANKTKLPPGAKDQNAGSRSEADVSLVNEPMKPTRGSIGLTLRSNVHQIPRVLKIVINRGLGEASLNTKLVDVSLEELTLISGQKTVVRKARKSVAGFKIREDMPVGIAVTLRGDRMYAFLDRLINLALPRIRDFQGLSPQSFDGNGNYSLGLKEQLMFPELDYDKIDKTRGLDISIVTSAESDDEAFILLKALGMPFNASLAEGNKK